MKDVVIIGGGLSGLINAILLSRKNLSVTLFERKKYPFHRVCGEYVSNEVIPFLTQNELFPYDFDPVDIRQFHLTSTNGQELKMKLDLGGFGISRYHFDHWLADKAKAEGVDIHEETLVEEVIFEEDSFIVKTRKESDFHARVVIGAFGKRSSLDKKLKREFIQKRSPYIGVKYHLITDKVPGDVVALHNFEGGYCGISRVEDGKYNLCYLSRRENLQNHHSIREMEEKVLFQNPYLKEIFDHSDFLFEKPEVINEISFSQKDIVKDHILMSGDAAGMITPLCGNGMAMAIHASKICSELVGLFFENTISRDEMEEGYILEWKENFSTRHWAGRKIQSLFGDAISSNLAINLGKASRPTARFLMRQTHGKPF